MGPDRLQTPEKKGARWVGWRGKISWASCLETGWSCGPLQFKTVGWPTQILADLKLESLSGSCNCDLAITNLWCGCKGTWKSSHPICLSACKIRNCPALVWCIVAQAGLQTGARSTCLCSGTQWYIIFLRNFVRVALPQPWTCQRFDNPY